MAIGFLLAGGGEKDNDSTICGRKKEVHRPCLDLEEQKI